MRDWKFIQTGNSEVKVTDVNGNNGSGSVTRMNNQYFAAYKTNDGQKGIEKFDTESQAVAFLKKKVGNAFDFETQAVVDRKEALKKAEEALRKAEAERNKHRGEQVWEESYITAKKDLERAKENLERAQRQKTGNESAIKVGDIVEVFGKKGKVTKIVSSDVVEVFFDNAGTNYPDRTDRYYTSEVKKVGNESVDKQEWSMFKGLKKDAEKEVGNESQDVEKMARLRQLVSGDIIKTKDGKVEIEKYDEIGFIGRDGKRYTWSEVKAYNSKTGNASASEEIRNEYNAEIYRLERKRDELERKGRGFEARKVREEIRKLQRELIELGNKKVGNDLPMDAEVKYNGYIIRYYPYQGKYIVTHPTDFSKTNAFIGKKFSTSEEAIKAIEKRGVGNAWTSADEKRLDELARKKATHLSDQEWKEFQELIKRSEQASKDFFKKTGNNLSRARNAMNKKVGNLDHVEEGDYVSVRYQGEIVDGVVRKIQGTQALVTIDGTDMWFPIRSLKEST